VSHEKTKQRKKEKDKRKQMSKEWSERRKIKGEANRLVKQEREKKYQRFCRRMSKIPMRFHSLQSAMAPTILFFLKKINT
jgi:hypothetical protein